MECEKAYNFNMCLFNADPEVKKFKSKIYIIFCFRTGSSFNHWPDFPRHKFT